MEKKSFKLALCIHHSDGAHIRKGCHVFFSTALILLLFLMASCSSMDEIALPARSSYSLMDTLKLNVPYVASKVYQEGGTFFYPSLDKYGHTILTTFDQSLIKIPLTNDSVGRRMAFLVNFSFFNGVIVSADTYEANVISMWIGRRNEKRYDGLHETIAMQGAREDDPQYRFYELIDAKTRDSLIIPGHVFVFHKRSKRSERRVIAVRKVKFDSPHSLIELVSNGDTTYTIHSDLHHQPALVYALKACERANFVVDLTCNPIDNSVLTLSLCPAWVQEQWFRKKKRLNFLKRRYSSRSNDEMSVLTTSEMNDLISSIRTECVSIRQPGRTNDFYIPMYNLKKYCELRAHMVKYFINAMGYHCKKVLINGIFHPHLFDCYGNHIIWGHHIAVALYERDSKGVVHMMIIDPVLFPEKAVTVDEWEDALYAENNDVSIEYYNENWLSMTMGREVICDCMYEYSRILLSQINRDVDDKMEEYLTYKGCSCRKKHPKACDLC